MLLLFSSISALGWMGVADEKTEEPRKSEDGSKIYAVYGRVSSRDYLPEDGSSPVRVTAKPRAIRGAGLSRLHELPAGFFFAVVPLFMGLLILVLYTFINDIEREDKVVLSRDLGSMDP